MRKGRKGLISKYLHGQSLVFISPNFAGMKIFSHYIYKIQFFLEFYVEKYLSVWSHNIHFDKKQEACHLFHKKARASTCPGLAVYASTHE